MAKRVQHTINLILMKQSWDSASAAASDDTHTTRQYCRMEVEIPKSMTRQFIHTRWEWLNSGRESFESQLYIFRRVKVFSSRRVVDTTTKALEQCFSSFLQLKIQIYNFSAATTNHNTLPLSTKLHKSLCDGGWGEKENFFIAQKRDSELDSEFLQYIDGSRRERENIVKRLKPFK